MLKGTECLVILHEIYAGGWLQVKHMLAYHVPGETKLASWRELAGDHFKEMREMVIASYVH